MEGMTMICRYCRQDVDNPCHDQAQLRERAMNHVERCEKAMSAELGDGIQQSDGQSGGSI
jgi:hypothetical protein